MEEQRIRILCVDDERNVLKSLERVFMDDEYEIITAVSGNDGLVILEEGKPVQVVISDYRMPVMCGVEFLKEVNRRWPDTERIVLSGYADAGAVVDAINEGNIYKFLTKPWNDEELKGTVNSALERYFLKINSRLQLEELRAVNAELEQRNRDLEKTVAKQAVRNEQVHDLCMALLSRERVDVADIVKRGTLSEEMKVFVDEFVQARATVDAHRINGEDWS